VFNLLLQVLDDGRLTDSQGRTVDFCHTVVIMTSNLASRAILENARQGAARGESQGEQPPEGQRRLEQAVEQALASHFRPEFLNRIDEVIRFRPLDLGDLGRIVRLQLAELAGLLAEQQLRLEVSEPVVQMLVSQGYEPEYGARPLRRVLRRRIENPLATELLAESFKGATAVRVELDNDQDRQLRFLAIP
jgi:ATP-dependent Clp protease ATP-binding subunit ClpA